MSQKKLTPPIAIALILLFIVIVFYILKIYRPSNATYPNPFDSQRKFYYDQPLGFYLRDYSKTTNITISPIQAKDISKDSLPLTSLREKYDESVIKWDIVASDELGKSIGSDVIGTCNIWLPVNTGENLPFSVYVRTHSVDACGFWNKIKKNDPLRVIGELKFEDQVVSTQPYKTEAVLIIRPMVVKFENDYYLDGKLPKSIVNQLLNSI